MSSLQDSLLLGCYPIHRVCTLCYHMSPRWGSLPTEIRVAAPFISPEGCTMSNRRQRLRTMLTSHRSCLEGNTSHTRGTAFQAFI